MITLQVYGSSSPRIWFQHWDLWCHTHLKREWKIYYCLHDRCILGEQGKPPKQVWEEKREDRRLAQDFIVVRRGTRLRLPKLRQGLHGLDCSMALKERTSGFPIRLLRGEEEGVRFKVVSKPQKMESDSLSQSRHCLVPKSCLTPDPIDCSPPGSSGHGIFQARTLEWIAIFLL